MYRSPNSQLGMFFETLQKICDIIFYQNKPIFISGNYNINMLSSEPASVKFSNKVKSYGFGLLVHEATRISKISRSSFLDNWLTNRKDLCKYTLADTYMSSDHMAILNNFSFNISKKTNQTTMVEYRSYSKQNIMTCVNFLQKVNWHLILDPYDVDTAFDIFLRTLLSAVDTCFPKKTNYS